MFNLRFIFALASLCVLISAGHAIADTEISGAVSGEWTSEGSPYIVVDSTWVPEGEMLSIFGRTEVLFNEQQGLHVFGELVSTGYLFSDSVIFRGSADVESWEGLKFYGQNELVMEYTHIECQDTAIFLNRGYTATFNHSKIMSELCGIASLVPGWGQAHWALNFNRSHYEGGQLLRTYGGVFTADSSWFDMRHGQELDNPRIEGESTSYILTHTEVTGTLSPTQGNVIIADCFFYKISPYTPVFAGVTGMNASMVRTIVEGGVSVGPGGLEPIPFTDNSVQGNFMSAYCRTSISNCTIQGMALFQEGSNATMQNTIVGGEFAFTGESLDIDSCYFGVIPSRFTIFCTNGNNLSVTRSVLNCAIVGQRRNSFARFDHNTIFMNWLNGGISIIGNHWYTNNIFVNLDQPFPLFYIPGLGDEELPLFLNNCIWGFDSYLDRADEIIEEPPFTNIIADPMLQWEGISWLLTADSPCIDAGNPDSPLDPDGTRSDIGARYFHQFNHGMDFGRNVCFPKIHSFETYPNPFNNAFNIMLPPENRGTVSVSIFDMNGRKIFQTNHSSNAGVINVDASKFPTGKYLIHLKSDKFSQTIPVSCLK